MTAEQAYRYTAGRLEREAANLRELASVLDDDADAQQALVEAAKACGAWAAYYNGEACMVAYKACMTVSDAAYEAHIDALCAANPHM